MDTEQIKQLVAMMVEHDLNRIEIREGDTHILLKRGDNRATGVSMMLPANLALPAAAAPVNPAGVAPASQAAQAGAAAPPERSTEVLIRSPMVGTYYSAPDPDSPPFLKVGDHVGRDSVVCLIEAMKVFNEIKAEVSGRVIRTLVQNGQAVEYDQPLFALIPD